MGTDANRQGRNLVPITQVANGWVMSSGLALTDRKSGETVQLPLDEANDYFADPSMVVSDPEGKRAFVASGGSDVVTVVDLARVAGWLKCATARKGRRRSMTCHSRPNTLLGGFQPAAIRGNWR